LAVVATAATLSAGGVRADDAKLDPARNEISVFGGASILDAKSGNSYTFRIPDLPGFPGFPDHAVSGDVTVSAEAKLGSSALFGARYSFYLRKQLAVEADFAVAPSHELGAEVGVCGPGGRCYGTGDYDQSGMAESFRGSMSGLFAGPMGGRFRGMGGMRGGRPEGGRGFGVGNLTAWHYGAGLTYDLLGGDVRPFVTVGAGGVSYDGARDARTSFVMRFGAGLKAYFGRVGARVDVVDHLVIDHYLSGDAEHDLHVTGGMLVRF
jgi:hypothetical protein